MTGHVCLPVCLSVCLSVYLPRCCHDRPGEEKRRKEEEKEKMNEMESIITEGEEAEEKAVLYFSRNYKVLLYFTSVIPEAAPAGHQLVLR
ncbi:hypothetical protein O3P69_020921 [Scylla paramamosain]|uniref:Uncharacterized protein n=1 Tax=Scylla paramamosain TaxID=85552 RepID=A0AAW0SFR3_SCYPA